jgi:hypothetical protein
MTNDTTPQQGRHTDFEAPTEFELDEFAVLATPEPANAYGPAWRERFATHHHLHNSIAS